MIKIRYVLAAVMLCFLSLQAWIFTTSDLLTGILVLITAIIMYRVVFDFQASNRRVARVNTREGGVLHAFLSKDKSLFTMVLSFVISFFMAFILVLILKGMVNSHGSFIFSIIIAVASISAYRFLNKGERTSELADRELASDLANHANKVLNIIIIAFMLNLVLSLGLSAHDTFVYLTNDVTFENFDKRIVNSPHVVVDNGSNTYSMVFMNLYIVMENFKLAISSQLLESLGVSLEQKHSYFYVIYFSIFFLNMFKLFTFSLSFVLLQKGFERFSTDLTPYVDKFLKKSAEKTKEYTPKAKEFTHNLAVKTKEQISKKVKEVSDNKSEVTHSEDTNSNESAENESDKKSKD